MGRGGEGEGGHTAEYVEFEVKRAFEWLAGDRNEGKRHAAVSITPGWWGRRRGGEGEGRGPHGRVRRVRGEARVRVVGGRPERREEARRSEYYPGERGQKGEG